LGRFVSSFRCHRRAPSLLPKPGPHRARHREALRPAPLGTSGSETDARKPKPVRAP
jgi:hypothetical protein